MTLRLTHFRAYSFLMAKEKHWPAAIAVTFVNSAGTCVAAQSLHPHATTVPSFLSARLYLELMPAIPYSFPAATATTLVSTCPERITRPLEPLRANPRHFPAATAVTPFKSAGTAVWPHRLSPQPTTVPSVFRARLKLSPAATAITLLRTRPAILSNPLVA